MRSRVRLLNDAPMRAAGRYVLYWCRANRRVDSNHALAFAAELANQADVPLLFFESLACTQPHANRRLHTFALEGVPETAASARALGIGYAFHLQRRRDEPTDAWGTLARDAVAVVTDDYPETIAKREGFDVPAGIDAPCYAVDSSCIVPMSEVERRCYAAFSIRPTIQKLLLRSLRPVAPIQMGRRFRDPAPAFHTEVTARNVAGLAAACQIDHSVRPCRPFHGGRGAGQRQLELFLEHRLHRYAGEENQPAAHATSDLSPYLHFGYLSATEVALAVYRRAGEHKLIAHEFLEELIVRRELAFNFARHAKRLDTLEELPDWARATLDAHRGDPRDPVYTIQQLECAATHDELWNAAQKELLLRGKIHGYYRMYWGKKIVEWSATPEEALAAMIRFHDRHALDGRGPNTYAGILWCFGLHDRPWPRRPVFGSIRYMSRAGMDRKTDVAAYIREIGHLELT